MLSFWSCLRAALECIAAQGCSTPVRTKCLSDNLCVLRYVCRCRFPRRCCNVGFKAAEIIRGVVAIWASMLPRVFTSTELFQLTKQIARTRSWLVSGRAQTIPKTVHIGHKIRFPESGSGPRIPIRTQRMHYAWDYLGVSSRALPDAEKRVFYTCRTESQSKRVRFAS